MFVALVVLTVLLAVRQSEYATLPFGFLLMLMLPAIGSSTAVKSIMFMLFVHKRLIGRGDALYQYNLEYADKMPSMKKMVFWSTLGTVAFAFLLGYGGGILPIGLAFYSSPGILVVLYSPALLVVSSINMGPWILGTKGLTFRKKGYGEVNTGHILFRFFDEIIGISAIISMAFALYLRSDSYQIIMNLILIAMLASPSFAFSIVISRKKLLPRLSRDLEVKLQRFVKSPMPSTNQI